MNIQEQIKQIAESKLDEITLFEIAVEALNDESLSKKEKWFFTEIKDTTRFAARLGQSVGLDYSLLQQDARSLLDA